MFTTSIPIYWEGWRTTIEDLKSSGWQVSINEKYTNWRDPDNTMAANKYVYLRHNKDRLIARLKFSDMMEESWKVEWIKHEKVTRKEKFFTQSFSELDILPLLNLIKSIQPKEESRKVIPQAEIIYIAKHLLAG